MAGATCATAAYLVWSMCSVPDLPANDHTIVYVIEQQLTRVATSVLRRAGSPARFHAQRDRSAYCITRNDADHCIRRPVRSIDDTRQPRAERRGVQDRLDVTEVESVVQERDASHRVRGMAAIKGAILPHTAARHVDLVRALR